MTNPLVTIVIIAYNEERHIREAIDSALSQTYSNIEVLLVDDGSRDQTLNIAKAYEPRIQVISQANSGNCSVPRNTGLKAAKGRFVSFLDGDDILTNDKIEKQVGLFEKYPDAAAVIGNYQNFGGTSNGDDHFSTCTALLNVINQSGGHCHRFDAGQAADILLEENFTIASSPLFQTTSVRELDGFCESLFSCEDFHLNYRVASRWPIVVTTDVLFKRRMHGSNMSSNQLKMSKYYFISRAKLKAIEADPKRRRALSIDVRSRYKRYLKNALKSGSWKDLPQLAKGLIDLG
ncbi:glycosyltransferase family 2 protein [Marinimicrobium sp. LS-A18]|uniref:glycosyltransferase family 2 protein n=1 Tax=Marinimicrobium sp. LS-A18 TaxID=1381596 RepID=UPI0004651CAA|nr:glycosyltransferase family 2 protein [Marinimicrobium sp. LS-A18]